jgi:hypothetical protein
MTYPRKRLRSGDMLKSLRKNAEAELSGAFVGRYFRGGVTRGRIAQIESMERVSKATELDYRAAVASAEKELARAARILRIAKALSGNAKSRKRQNFKRQPAYRIKGDGSFYES